MVPPGARRLQLSPVPPRTHEVAVDQAAGNGDDAVDRVSPRVVQIIPGCADQHGHGEILNNGAGLELDQMFSFVLGPSPVPPIGKEIQDGRGKDEHSQKQGVRGHQSSSKKKTSSTRTPRRWVIRKTSSTEGTKRSFSMELIVWREQPTSLANCSWVRSPLTTRAILS